VDEEDKHAFMFSQEGKLTFVSGDQASTQATVSLDHVLCRIQVAGVESDHVFTLLTFTLSALLRELQRCHLFHTEAHIF